MILQHTAPKGRAQAIMAHSIRYRARYIRLPQVKPIVPLSYAGMTQIRFKGTKANALSQPHGAPSGFPC